jgi:hypothetical protein
MAVDEPRIERRVDDLAELEERSMFEMTFVG